MAAYKKAFRVYLDISDREHGMAWRSGVVVVDLRCFYLNEGPQNELDTKLTFLFKSVLTHVVWLVKRIVLIREQRYISIVDDSSVPYDRDPSDMSCVHQCTREALHTMGFSSPIYTSAREIRETMETMIVVLHVNIQSSRNVALSFYV